MERLSFSADTNALGRHVLVRGLILVPQVPVFMERLSLCADTCVFDRHVLVRALTASFGEEMS